MCPNKTWFDTYEEKSGGNVFMGNDVSCKTIGIGTVKIKMHDGIIRTLTEVRHVPELKKNLISIGIMDGKGFKCSTKNGVMKTMPRWPIRTGRKWYFNQVIEFGYT